MSAEEESVDPAAAPKDTVVRIGADGVAGDRYAYRDYDGRWYDMATGDEVRAEEVGRSGRTGADTEHGAYYDVEARRPAAHLRWVEPRVEPVVVEARTRFLYSPSRRDAKRRPGVRGLFWAFSRGAVVVRGEETRWPYGGPHNGVMDHVGRGMALFGDDADLVITITRRGDGA